MAIYTKATTTPHRFTLRVPSLSDNNGYPSFFKARMMAASIDRPCVLECTGMTAASTTVQPTLPPDDDEEEEARPPRRTLCVEIV